MALENELEVEGKILDINLEELIDRIYALGGKKVFEWELRAQWLINVNGEKIRVRKEGSKILVEHKAWQKSAIAGIKTNKETRFWADNFEDVIGTFLRLWFKNHVQLSVKNRVSFILEWIDPTGVVKLDIDTYSDLQSEIIPPLLEIEAGTHEVVVKVAELLGYNASDLKDYGPVELLRHYYPNKISY